MKLPALSVEEKAFLASTRDESTILGNLSERVRCRMTACLGVPVRVSSARAIQTSNPGTSKAPRIVPSHEVMNAWVSARFGGYTRTESRQAPTGLSESLMRTLKCALAESVINLGKDVVWPEAVRLEIRIQEQEGAVEFSCVSQHLMRWAKAEMERAR